MLPDSIIYIPLQPKLDSQSKALEFGKFCCELAAAERSDATLAKLATELTQDISKSSVQQKDKEALTFLVLKSVILDLVNQGWQLLFNNSKPGLSYPLLPDNSKELVRKRHSFDRRAQLATKSVQNFILNMENNGVFSLMRDGKELAEALRLNPSQAIEPYLQFAEGNHRCEQTGLRLMDIWRYFRYTWVNAYRSTPGRSVRILVRDGAAANHPVIGIASLGNTVIQQTVRDNWIGWNVETFLKNFDCPSNLAQWCSKTLGERLSDVYQEDLKQEGLYSEIEGQKPTSSTIDKLKRASQKSMETYHQTPKESETLRRTERSGADWIKRARTHLYKSKRCAKLASLLSIRKTLQEEPISDVAEISKRVRTAINQLLRIVKAEHVGENMMDITTCGAIAPYNHLLGGKLVSMLVCSPEVAEHYKAKYAQNARIIASSMKGAPVTREAHLVLLTTTSLYEVGASQYNRVKIPANAFGQEIAYQKLGLTEGFGTFHLSQETLALLELLIDASDGRVVSVFGEGPSPLLRKIREALSLAGLPSHTILNHKSRRIIYGIPLAENFREVLTGLEQQPIYTQERNSSTLTSIGCTGKIAEYWRIRWFTNRIKNPRVLEEVVRHTGPCHGARVQAVSEIRQQVSRAQLSLPI